MCRSGHRRSAESDPVVRRPAHQAQRDRRKAASSITHSVGATAVAFVRIDSCLRSERVAAFNRKRRPQSAESECQLEPAKLKKGLSKSGI
jgi:hypothetical protein